MSTPNSEPATPAAVPDLEILILEEIVTFLREGSATHVADHRTDPIPVERIQADCQRRMRALRGRRHLRN